MATTFQVDSDIWGDEPTVVDAQPLPCRVSQMHLIAARGQWAGRQDSEIRDTLRAADPRKTQEIPAVKS